MKITDTQQAAQYSASAAVSAAEAKQYLLSIEQPIIDIEGSVSDAKDAAILSRQAMEEAKAISSGLSESIDFEIAAKEAEFESQMQDQRSNFESAQQAKENDFISSQTQMESEFEASQANKESRFQEFLDSSGYVFLGDYENGPFQFNARNQYIRYNNQYYRLNAATDVGFITTGTTAASFANDVTHFVLMDGDTLRQNLGSGEEGLGGSLVMLPQEISVSDALKGVVVVSGADGTGVIDATEIIQAYLDYARDHGINTVRLPPGDYKVQKYTHQIELPHDDGTVYPGWVSSGSDINLAPEPVHYIYAALKLHPGIFLTGDTMLTTTINGGWDIATGPIGKDSGVGVWFSTSNVQSDHLGGGLINIGMRNFFIGRYGTGCTVDTVEDRIYHKNCAIAAIFQAKERCKHGFIHVEPGYAGDVVGGQWWYRSDSVSARHIPPYPAPQIYLTSWMDACLFEKYWFVQYDEAFGARHEAIDNFFDTYFMKSANHARQAEGGRLSNTSGGGSINKFKGIVGRAIYTPALYGQQPNANLLLSLKTYGTHRTAVATGENAVNSGAMNFIQSAYIERSGLVSPFGTIGAGNYFGIDYVDLWEPARVGVGYSVVDGFFGMGKILRSTGQPAAYGSFRSYNQESAPTRKTIFIDSIEDPNLFEYSEQYDRAGRSSVPYRRYSDKCYMPPVMFNDGSRQFSFVHNSFSATLLSTDAAIMSGTGYYCRKGNEITPGWRLLFLWQLWRASAGTSEYPGFRMR